MAFTLPLTTPTARATPGGPPSRPPSIIDRVPFRALRHKGGPSKSAPLRPKDVLDRSLVACKSNSCPPGQIKGRQPAPIQVSAPTALKITDVDTDSESLDIGDVQGIINALHAIELGHVLHPWQKPLGASLRASVPHKAPTFGPVGPYQVRFDVPIEEAPFVVEQMKAVDAGFTDLDFGDVLENRGVPTPEQLDGLYLRCVRLLIAKESADWREILHQLFAVEYGLAELPA